MLLTTNNFTEIALYLNSYLSVFNGEFYQKGFNLKFYLYASKNQQFCQNSFFFKLYLDAFKTYMAFYLKFYLDAFNNQQFYFYLKLYLGVFNNQPFHQNGFLFQIIFGRF